MINLNFNVEKFKCSCPIFRKRSHIDTDAIRGVISNIEIPRERVKFVLYKLKEHYALDFVVVNIFQDHTITNYANVGSIFLEHSRVDAFSFPITHDNSVIAQVVVGKHIKNKKIPKIEKFIGIVKDVLIGL